MFERACFGLLLFGAVASADPDPSPTLAGDGHPAARTADATMGTIFHGPFQSSRLFSIPTADVVGAYVLSISAEGSLLQQTGVLTSAGVVAIGFGDVAQLEYRQSAAISVTGVDAPIPAVGVQLKLPIPDRLNVPAFGIAFRVGVPRREQFGATDVDEKVTDLYLMGRLRFTAAPWLTLHGGVRASSASIELTNDPTRGDGKFSGQRTLWLPAGGYEVTMTPTAKLVGELELAPQFSWTPGSATDPRIGSAWLGRLGLRWSIVPSVVFDSSIGYQVDALDASQTGGLRDVVSAWDIRLGAEVFVPWGSLACRAVGVFCD